jgi:lipoate-protein ligase A
MTIISRIIDDGPHHAPFNMAADLYLLSQCEQSPCVFVRLYSWKTPSITLGAAEKPEETLDIEAIARSNVAWIRRPTGGRSVLHDHDITYSCIFSQGIREMGTTLMETYEVISGCLMEGLDLSGIQCASHDSGPDNQAPRGRAKLPCFLSPNRHEIMVRGKKLVGSAQKRTSKAVLQHGSIPLTPAFRELPDLLALEPEQRTLQKRMLRQKTTCISEILPGFEEEEIRRNLIKGFRAGLALTLRGIPWTPLELDEIRGRAEPR